MKRSFSRSKCHFQLISFGGEFCISRKGRVSFGSSESEVVDKEEDGGDCY